MHGGGEAFAAAAGAKMAETADKDRVKGDKKKGKWGENVAVKERRNSNVHNVRLGKEEGYKQVVEEDDKRTEAEKKREEDKEMKAKDREEAETLEEVEVEVTGMEGASTSGGVGPESAQEKAGGKTGGGSRDT
ncbi:hypothetical protein CgunFtcFv8_026340 [Champsocephalus gunnari]|uniref:Uncharacterized protein n=2 Tax=Champsocephalus gunnari TaxID=52237 RepID=A0AAN8CDC1_CHAGU|nr:hypothetical protein CgunFtcFv8_026340 [Champsocephalus gunnari]